MPAAAQPQAQTPAQATADHSDRIWNEVNPASLANLGRLAITEVTLCTGDGNGSVLSPTCKGDHTYGCWAPALADYIPRLANEFAQAG